MVKSRLPLFVAALAGLLLGIWAGWLRIGWPWPPLAARLPALHGPLMVAGFLGTLICLERAVAAQERRAYLLPLFCAAGTLLVLLGPGGRLGILLITCASAGLLLLFLAHLRRQRTLFTAVMAGGALLWLVGNLIWISGRPLYLVVWWWAGFLVLTIAGERLELSRVLRQPRRVQWLFVGAALVLTSGLFVTFFNYALGVRLTGLGMLLLAAWLLLFDLARRNIRKPGLTGYIAAALLSGYVWLAFAGTLALWAGPVSAGPTYDAILHAAFLGFTFGMIMGHAPIIFPAVLGSPLPYSPTFYLPLILLQVTLLLRVIGDLFGLPAARQWGGLLNGVVLLLFLATMVTALRRGRVKAQTAH